MKKFLLPLTCACCYAATFDLDPSQTQIGFLVHSTLHTVHGTFKLKRGVIQMDEETGKASGEIVIDVASGESGNGPRDKRMQKEVLESQKYPDAVFTADRVEGHIAPQGASEIEVHGIFRMHGSDHELKLHLEVQGTGDRYTATTHFAIPYVEWGMKNPSNFLLKVDPKAEMEVRAVAGRTPDVHARAGMLQSAGT